MSGRDPIDFHEVLPEHIAIHERLENWAHWLRPRGGSSLLPMFRFFRNGYRDSPAPWYVVDELDAQAIQACFAFMPELSRHAIGWVYLEPWIPDYRVCKTLGVNRRHLMDLIRAGRASLKTTVRKPLDSLKRCGVESAPTT